MLLHPTAFWPPTDQSSAVVLLILVVSEVLSLLLGETRNKFTLCPDQEGNTSPTAMA